MFEMLLASGGELPGTVHWGNGIRLQRCNVRDIDACFANFSRSVAFYVSSLDMPVMLGRFQIPSDHPAVHVPG